MTEPFNDNDSVNFSLIQEILHEAAGLTPEEFDCDGVIESYIQRLRQARSSMDKTTLRKRVRELRKEAADKKKAEAQAEMAQRPPDKYMVENGGFVIETLAKWGLTKIQISNFTAEILTDIALDDGSGKIKSFYEIAATLNGITKTTTVDATDFAKLEWRPHVLDSDAAIYVYRAAERHVEVAIRVLSINRVKKTVYTHTGWGLIERSPVYFHSGGGIGPDGVVPGVSVDLGLPKLAAFCLPEPAEDPRASINLTLEFLNLAPKRITVPSFGASLRALLSKADFSAYLHGRTGLYKTQMTMLVQQNYGAGFFPADNLPGSFRSTLNYNEAVAYRCKDAICVIDDLHPAGNSSEREKMFREANGLVRSQADQLGRGRMDKDGSLKTPTYPRGVLSLSGEDSFAGESLNVRMITIEVRDGDIDQGKLTECQHNAGAGHYAQCTASYVKWLAGNWSAVQQYLKKEVSCLRGAFQYKHPRTASMHAQLLVSYAVFAAFLVEVGVHDELESQEFMHMVSKALQEAIDAHQNFAGEKDDPTVQFRELLRSAILSGKAHLTNMQGKAPPDQWRGVCGWREERQEWVPKGLRVGWLQTNGYSKPEAIYLDPATAYKAALEIAAYREGIEVSQETLIRRLRDQKLLVRVDPDGKHLTIRIRIPGAIPRVLHLNPDFLLSSEPAAGE